LNATPGAASTVRVGGKGSIFDMPTSERQFVRRMANLAWTHRLMGVDASSGPTVDA
jgi:hypothetical protein